MQMLPEFRLSLPYSLSAPYDNVRACTGVLIRQKGIIVKVFGCLSPVCLFQIMVCIYDRQRISVSEGNLARARRQGRLSKLCNGSIPTPDNAYVRNRGKEIVNLLFSSVTHKKTVRFHILEFLQYTIPCTDDNPYLFKLFCRNPDDIRIPCKKSSHKRIGKVYRHIRRGNMKNHSPPQTKRACLFKAIPQFQYRSPANPKGKGDDIRKSLRLLIRHQYPGHSVQKRNCTFLKWMSYRNIGKYTGEIL